MITHSDSLLKTFGPGFAVALGCLLFLPLAGVSASPVSGARSSMGGCASKGRCQGLSQASNPSRSGGGRPVPGASFQVSEVSMEAVK